MVKVYIFDAFYAVQEGDLLTFNKKYGSKGQRFIFFTDIGKPVIGTIVDATDTSCSLGILMIDNKEEVISGRAPRSQASEKVDLVNEEKATKDDEVNFDSMTKKELIAYIEENNLPIETNKVHKAAILEALKSL